MTLVAIHILLEANQQLKLTLTTQFSPTAFGRTRPCSNAPNLLLWICERDAGVHSAFECTMHTLITTFTTAFERTPPAFERDLQKTYFLRN